MKNHKVKLSLNNQCQMMELNLIINKRFKYFFLITFCIIAISFLVSACNSKKEKITNLEQIAGKRICVLPGSAGDITARSKYTSSNFIVLVSSSDAALAVKNGKADVFIYDKSVLLKIVEKNPDLVILEKPISRLEVAIAFNKQNTNLLSDINKALSVLKENGTLQNLRKKWVDSEYSVPPSLPANTSSGSNGTLRMGTCAIYEPFSFQSNGKFTGLDIELSILLGELLGKKIEIIDMAFEGLIPSLQSGKIDFALSDFNVTEERKKSINYSIPYLDNDISALVKK